MFPLLKSSFFSSFNFILFFIPLSVYRSIIKIWFLEKAIFNTFISFSRSLTPCSLSDIKISYLSNFLGSRVVLIWENKPLASSNSQSLIFCLNNCSFGDDELFFKGVFVHPSRSIKIRVKLNFFSIFSSYNIIITMIAH